MFWYIQQEPYPVLRYGSCVFIGIYIKKIGNFRELVNAELLLQFIGNDGCTDANLFVQLPFIEAEDSSCNRFSPPKAESAIIVEIDIVKD